MKAAAAILTYPALSAASREGSPEIKIRISTDTDKAGWFYSQPIDLTGKKVLVTSPQKAESGKNTFVLDLSALKKGIYTMNNYISNNRYTLKVVIIE